MTPAARLSAAIEVIADIEARRRPAADALKDWGLAHRFAGSSDRAAIAGLVYDALRRKSSSAWLMGEASPRAVLIGMLHRERGLDVAAIEALCSGARFAPAPLTEAERAALATRQARERAAARSGRLSGLARSASCAGLRRGTRAPRAPRWRAGRRSTCASTRSSPSARRCCRSSRILAPSRRDGRRSACAFGLRPTPKVRRSMPSRCFRKGAIEIQDEGSQLAALFAGAKPGEQVIDLCAGAGGKTLALAAVMENRGQIYATDIDKRQLAPIHERIARAGARNIQVRTPRGEADVLADLAGRIDLVLIDAPCTGTGTWRRNPDAKWRVRPGRAGGARQAAGRGARSRRRAGQAGRPHRLRHLLGAGRGKRRPDPRLSVPASGFRRRAAARDRRRGAGRARRTVLPRGAGSRRRGC